MFIYLFYRNCAIVGLVFSDANGDTLNRRTYQMNGNIEYCLQISAYYALGEVGTADYAIYGTVRFIKSC